MSSTADIVLPIRLPGRANRARERAEEARAALAECHLCAHHCGVNRLDGERGPCHAGTETRVFSAQIEVSDELELIPTFAIALSGCDLRCAFCITGAQSWNPRDGERLTPAVIAADAKKALEDGATSIQILGGEPTIHLPWVLELVAGLPDDVRIVWKTNAHGSAQSRILLQGLMDVWLADYKFGNNLCATTLADVPHYEEVVQENLRWAFCESELIVRHLVMPGHVACCWQPVAQWLAENLPGVKVSLRSGFWPAWRAGLHAGLQRPVTGAETAEALRLARDYGLNLIS